MMFGLVLIVLFYNSFTWLLVLCITCAVLVLLLLLLYGLFWLCGGGFAGCVDLIVSWFVSPFGCLVWVLVIA